MTHYRTVAPNVFGWVYSGNPASNHTKSIDEKKNYYYRYKRKKPKNSGQNVAFIH